MIFDVETNGVARKLRGHTRQIQSLRSTPITIVGSFDSQSAAGPVTEDTYSVRPKIGNVYFGISAMARVSELFDLRRPFTLQRCTLTISLSRQRHLVLVVLML